MKRTKSDNRPFAGVRFDRELIATTPKGDEVQVRYRRVPRRGGYDIEAAIISKRPTVIISEMGRQSAEEGRER